MKKPIKIIAKKAPKITLSDTLGVKKPASAMNLEQVFAHGCGKSTVGAKSVSSGTHS